MDGCSRKTVSTSISTNEKKINSILKRKAANSHDVNEMELGEEKRAKRQLKFALNTADAASPSNDNFQINLKRRSQCKPVRIRDGIILDGLGPLPGPSTSNSKNKISPFATISDDKLKRRSQFKPTRFVDGFGPSPGGVNNTNSVSVDKLKRRSQCKPVRIWDGVILHGLGPSPGASTSNSKTIIPPFKTSEDKRAKLQLKFPLNTADNDNFQINLKRRSQCKPVRIRDGIILDGLGPLPGPSTSNSKNKISPFATISDDKLKRRSQFKPTRFVDGFGPSPGGVTNTNSVSGNKLKRRSQFKPMRYEGFGTPLKEGTSSKVLGSNLKPIKYSTIDNQGPKRKLKFSPSKSILKKTEQKSPGLVVKRKTTFLPQRPSISGMTIVTSATKKTLNSSLMKPPIKRRVPQTNKLNSTQQILITDKMDDFTQTCREIGIQTEEITPPQPCLPQNKKLTDIASRDSLNDSLSLFEAAEKETATPRIHIPISSSTLRNIISRVDRIESFLFHKNTHTPKTFINNDQRRTPFKENVVQSYRELASKYDFLETPSSFVKSTRLKKSNINLSCQIFQQMENLNRE